MYNLTTINCNGLLNNFSIIKCLSHNFRSQYIDFLFLQETHVHSLGIAKNIESKFNGKAFWSFGSNVSCGVGIIILPPRVGIASRPFVFDQSVLKVTIALENLYVICW